MKLVYDDELNIAGIGVYPWSRLGPEKWFKNYKIASYYDWDIDGTDVPEVYPLIGSSQKILRSNTQSLLANKMFQDILLSNFKNYNLMTYSPQTLKIPDVLRAQQVNFLGAITPVSLENKITFREKFSEKLPFPKYKVFDKVSGLGPGEILWTKGSAVVQHESLSGGKGTYVVHDLQQAESALNILGSKSHHKGLVVSEFIEGGLERSLQCCVTRYGTFVGPLQKQLININELQNPENHGNKFCGTEISPDDSAIGLYSEMSKLCKVVGQELFSNGYRGIFGVDFLIAQTGQLYVLEVNQRLTGATPLLTMFYRPEQDIPFYLLHILESGGFSYEITDHYIDPKPPVASMMILHSHKRQPSKVIKNIRSGLYSPEGKFLSPDYAVKGSLEGNFLAQRYSPTSETVKPANRLAVVFSNDKVLNNKDRLTKNSVARVKLAYRMISQDSIE